MDRSKRVAGEVKRLLSQVLATELRDPDIPALAAVTEVSVNRDLTLATVYVSCLGGSTEKEQLLHSLEKARGFLRSRVAEHLNLRKAMELRFLFDDSLERGARLSALIDQVRQEDRAREAECRQREAAETAVSPGPVLEAADPQANAEAAGQEAGRGNVAGRPE